MSENKSIPEHNSYEEMAEYWDTHSLGEVWDQTEPVEFDVSNPLQNRFYIPIDGKLLESVRQIAHSRGVSTKTLINTMIESRMEEMKTK